MTASEFGERVDILCSKNCKTEQELAVLYVDAALLGLQISLYDPADETEMGLLTAIKILGYPYRKNANGFFSGTWYIIEPLPAL